MKKSPFLFRTVPGALLCAAAFMSCAQAQTATEIDAYPNKPIRIVVPYTPGAINDILARATGQHLSEAIKQPVIIENRPGGATVIGTDHVAKAAPDGYTILQVPASHSINATLMPRLPYDSFKSFTFVTLAATSPFVVVASPKFAAKSIPELIALAKANPGKYTYASSGNGGNAHLMGEMLKSMAKIDVLHVPYKGASPAMNDVMGGQVDFMFISYSAANGAIKAGKLRALGVTSKERWSALPDLPTIAEAGLPDYEAIGWWGYAVPAGTPPKIVAKLNSELNKVLQSKPMRAHFEKEGLDMLGTTPEQFVTFLKTETQAWAKTIKDGNIRID
jgi:tripartite-type tricarboxylate transporter receptor subunit TctC